MSATPPTTYEIDPEVGDVIIANNLWLKIAESPVTPGNKYVVLAREIVNDLTIMVEIINDEQHQQRVYFSTHGYTWFEKT